MGTNEGAFGLKPLFKAGWPWGGLLFGEILSGDAMGVIEPGRTPVNGRYIGITCSGDSNNTCKCT